MYCNSLIINLAQNLEDCVGIEWVKVLLKCAEFWKLIRALSSYLGKTKDCKDLS